MLRFVKGPTQGLDDTILTAEAIYPISFTQPNKRLSLKYDGSNNFLFVNATEIYQLKTKNSKIKSYTLCLDNISKDFAINTMKKTGLGKGGGGGRGMGGLQNVFLLILILLILTII